MRKYPPAQDDIRVNSRSNAFVFMGLFFALPCLAFFAFYTQEASAFSLERIQVKSNFGDRFDAEIELKADHIKGIKVTIAAAKDYKNLGIKREGVIRELYIKPPLIIRGKRYFVKVVSDIPLFYPSFNLLLKAERASGPIFENYLITVDFQDSVSLKGVRARGSFKGALKDSSPGSTRARSTNGGKGFPDSGTLDADSGASVIAARNPAPLETRKIIPPPVMKAFPKPTPKKETKKDRGPFRPGPPSALPQTAALPFDDAVSDASGLPAESFKRKKYGPLKPGENLGKISLALNYKPSLSSRVAVALWMDNSDMFINGNIHGLKKGAELEIGNLDNRLKTLNSLQADQIIRDHWQEWNSGRKQPAPVEEELVLPVADEQAAPVAKDLLAANDDNSLEEKLLGITADWKDSWEKEDLNRHMALFYKEPAGVEVRRNRGFEYWRQFKKKMFDRHDKVQISIDNPKLVRLKNKTSVVFDQIFESDQMKSSGRKTIEFVRAGSGWKILREEFSVKKFKDKAEGGAPVQMASGAAPTRRTKAGSPIVIHASTRPDFAAAEGAVKELRQMGFDAYFSPLYVSQTKKQYRVIVGRFSDMALAQELTRALKKFKTTRNAVPMKSPYVLQVGEHMKKADAQRQARKLQAQGFPSFLYFAREDKSSELVARVFVGTFADRKNALRMAQDLMGGGIISVVKEP